MASITDSLLGGRIKTSSRHSISKHFRPLAVNHSSILSFLVAKPSLFRTSTKNATSSNLLCLKAIPPPNLTENPRIPSVTLIRDEKFCRSSRKFYYSLTIKLKLRKSSSHGSNNNLPLVPRSLQAASTSGTVVAL